MLSCKSFALERASMRNAQNSRELCTVPDRCSYNGAWSCRGGRIGNEVGRRGFFDIRNVVRNLPVENPTCEAFTYPQAKAAHGTRVQIHSLFDAEPTGRWIMKPERNTRLRA